MFKTEVCKKSLNPQWNSEWFKFEVCILTVYGTVQVIKCMHGYNLLMLTATSENLTNITFTCLLEVTLENVDVFFRKQQWN